MLAIFDKVIHHQLQIHPTDKVLLAISGGMDSMCMLDLFLKINHPIAIAHCNYQLRGVDSDLDAQLVERISKANNTHYHVQKFDIDKSSGGIQLQARNMRYAWFEELREKYNYQYIATAHHLDDQAETFFINLIRGTGLEGLSGIPLKNNRTIRPLLSFTKNQIENWASEAKVEFREDISNKTDAYLRNRIRHHIIPLLEKENINFKSNFKQTLNKLNQTKSVLLKNVDIYRRNIINHVDYDTLLLSELPDDSFNLILHHLLKPYNVSWTQTENISTNRTKSGLTFDTSSHQIILNRGQLIIKNDTRPKKISLDLEQDQKNLLIPDIGYLQLNQPDTFIPDKSPNIETFDAANIVWPLRVRNWEHGDVFEPLGMEGHHQKLQDFFTNNKINLLEKEKILIVEDQNSIIWIVGHRISDKVKISNSTKDFLQIRFTSINKK